MKRIIEIIVMLISIVTILMVTATVVIDSSKRDSEVIEDYTEYTQDVSKLLDRFGIRYKDLKKEARKVKDVNKISELDLTLERNDNIRLVYTSCRYTQSLFEEEVTLPKLSYYNWLKDNRDIAVSVVPYLIYSEDLEFLNSIEGCYANYRVTKFDLRKSEFSDSVPDSKDISIEEYNEIVRTNSRVIQIIGNHTEDILLCIGRYNNGGKPIGRNGFMSDENHNIRGELVKIYRDERIRVDYKEVIDYYLDLALERGYITEEERNTCRFKYITELPQEWQNSDQSIYSLYNEINIVLEHGVWGPDRNRNIAE